MSVFGFFLVRIQSECEKIRTRKTPNTDAFHAVLLCYLFNKTMLLDLMKTFGLKASAEAQLETCQTSKMECFAKIVNG